MSIVDWLRNEGPGQHLWLWRCPREKWGESSHLQELGRQEVGGGAGEWSKSGDCLELRNLDTKVKGGHLLIWQIFIKPLLMYQVPYQQ